MPQEDSFFVHRDAGAHITHHAEGDQMHPAQLGSCGVFAARAQLETALH